MKLKWKHHRQVWDIPLRLFSMISNADIGLCEPSHDTQYVSLTSPELLTWFYSSIFLLKFARCIGWFMQMNLANTAIRWGYSHIIERVNLNLWTTVQYVSGVWNSLEKNLTSPSCSGCLIRDLISWWESSCQTCTKTATRQVFIESLWLFKETFCFIVLL